MKRWSRVGSGSSCTVGRSDVTTRDYFHPSVSGQAKLAAVTWGAAAAFVGS